MKWLRLSFYFLVVLFLLSSCKKEDNNYKIEGRVIDGSNGNGVAGAHIELSQQKLSGGTFNSTFTTITAQNSASDGSFAFSFARENAAEYRLEYQKTGYFNGEKSLNPDNLTPGEVFTQNLTLTPKSSVEVHLINENPFDEFDQLTFQYVNANFQCTCCSSDEHQFNGMDVDTLISCDLYGNYWLRYFVQIEKDTTNIFFVDSIYCTAFELTSFDIVY